MRKNIFITYDFGMKGDYEGLFKWLDENAAEERGYGVARIANYEIDKGVTTDIEFLRSVKSILKDKVKIGNSDRIYMIWPSFEKPAVASGFLFGKQKQSPWEGFAQKTGDEIDIDL